MNTASGCGGHSFVSHFEGSRRDRSVISSRNGPGLGVESGVNLGFHLSSGRDEFLPVQSVGDYRDAASGLIESPRLEIPAFDLGQSRTRQEQFGVVR